MCIKILYAEPGQHQGCPKYKDYVTSVLKKSRALSDQEVLNLLRDHLPSYVDGQEDLIFQINQDLS